MRSDFNAHRDVRCCGPTIFAHIEYLPRSLDCHMTWISFMCGTRAELMAEARAEFSCRIGARLFIDIGMIHLVERRGTICMYLCV